MNLPQSSVAQAVDSIQKRLTGYACELQYRDLSPEAIHAAKVRIIDTLGALIGGFFGEPCRIARSLATQMLQPNGVTVLGTRLKTSADIAAFVNATTARDAEMNDVYHGPKFHGHPSDTIAPTFAVAEHAHANGRDFITGVILAYEMYMRMADAFNNAGFDTTNFGCLGVAVASGKLLGLSPTQLSHCISMAVVPNNILRQVRTTTCPLSMFKSVAAGQAGRAGVFAAMLAQSGMEGPYFPFEGKAGWCDHVAGVRFSLPELGGEGTAFKIIDTHIKHRASCGSTISSILAAEKVASLTNIKEVRKVTVEVYQYAKIKSGVDEHHWNPDSRETADHSIPYVTAATLMDGAVTPSSFNDAHLGNQELRTLMRKIEVVENKEFTKGFEKVPPEHRTRVTVITNLGERLVGETGGGDDDLTTPKSDAQIEEKFRQLTEEILGAKRVAKILDCLWHLEDLGNVAEIPPAFVLT